VKGLILAGGYATRLRPLSCSKPKLLFPIVGVPLIDVMLDWMKPAGVTEVILAVNHLADRLRTEIGEKRKGLDIFHSVEPEPLGTGGPIRLAKKFLGSDDPFLVLNGDIVSNLDLRKMIKAHEENDHVEATIALVEVRDPSTYGLVRLDEDRKIKQFDEKTKSVDGPGIVNAGVYILSPRILERIPDGGMVSIERQVFPKLVKDNLMQGWEHRGGYWYDMGKIPDYVRVNRELLERSNEKNETWKEGPVHIGKGSLVEKGAQIGIRTILSDKVTVKSGSSIRNSIVFEESVIEEDCHVEGSIVGERVRLGRGVKLGPGSMVAGEISIPAGRTFNDNSVVLNA
jgi:NDP-sugar pyrophosphorylase family protein